LENSYSLEPCLFIQAIFDRMTTQGGKSLYVTTEFGFGLAITTAITALIVWWKPASQSAALGLDPAQTPATAAQT
jgi:hypothetical protein